jgi:transposase
MTRYVGLDVHKRFIEVCVLDAKGKVVFRGKVESQHDALTRFAKERLKRGDHLALEATTNTWPVADVLQPFVAEIVVGNAMKTKAIAEAKVKTDKVDAEVLAQLLRCDYLPSVWRPDEATRQLRGWLTHRAALITQRSRLKNQVHNLVSRLLLHPPCKVLWTKTGLSWLQGLELPAQERLVLDSNLRQMVWIKRECAFLDQHLAELAAQEPRVHLLMTIPGINYVVAFGILAALGDLGRFRDGNHAAAYVGLTPTTRQSANRCYHGHITKAGNSLTRGLLTQAAQHASRHAGPLGAFFRRLTKRKNRSVAITALARKLVTIAFLMLKNNEPYRYARPELMREKFSKLNVLKPKSIAPRKAGQAKPGLGEIYKAAGLPQVTSPENLPAGEQHMLKERQLNGFVQELYRPPRSPKKTLDQNTKSTPAKRRSKERRS